MSEVIEHYEFKPRGTWSKYPWDEWLDGRIWRIYEGTDVRNIRTFRSYLYNRAYKRGCKIESALENADSMSNPTALVFRAVR